MEVEGESLTEHLLAVDNVWKDVNPLLWQLAEGIIEEYPEKIKSALKAGADPNTLIPVKRYCEDYVYRVPMLPSLVLALQFERSTDNVVQMLIEAGADVNNKGTCRFTPLQLACSQESNYTVQAIIDAGAIIDKNTGGYALACAIAANKPSHVELLIKHGCNVDGKGLIVDCPLLSAAACGFTEVVEVLVEYNCDLQSVNQNERSALHLASSLGHWKVVDLLIKKNMDANMLDYFSNTPLHLTGYAGCSKTIKLLLDAGSDPNAENDKNLRPINIALRRRHYSAVKTLIKGGTRLNSSKSSLLLDYLEIYKSLEWHWYPEHSSTMHIGREMIQILVEAGYNISADPFVSPISDFIKNLSFFQSDLKDENVEFFNWLENVASQPLTLQQVCRDAIRKHLGLRVEKKIDRLPIPSVIKEFLSFSHL